MNEIKLFDENGKYVTYLVFSGDSPQFKDIEKDKEIERLKKEISDYQNGWLGCCHTCEPVALLNERLNSLIHDIKCELIIGKFEEGEIVAFINKELGGESE